MPEAPAEGVTRISPLEASIGYLTHLRHAWEQAHEGESIAENDLVVPHPRLVRRAFALRPLVDLAPDAGDGESGGLYADNPLAKTQLTRVRDGE